MTSYSSCRGGGACAPYGCPWILPWRAAIILCVNPIWWQKLAVIANACSNVESFVQLQILGNCYKSTCSVLVQVFSASEMHRKMNLVEKIVFEQSTLAEVGIVFLW